MRQNAIRCERRGNTDGGLAADMSLAPGCRTALVLARFLFVHRVSSNTLGLRLILISPLHHPKVSFWKKKATSWEVELMHQEALCPACLSHMRGEYFGMATQGIVSVLNRRVIFLTHNCCSQKDTGVAAHASSRYVGALTHTSSSDMLAPWHGRTTTIDDRSSYHHRKLASSLLLAMCMNGNNNTFKLVNITSRYAMVTSEKVR